MNKFAKWANFNQKVSKKNKMMNANLSGFLDENHISKNNKFINADLPKSLDELKPNKD
jgi:hypothetical protein